jgi:hypothetical protein
MCLLLFYTPVIWGPDVLVQRFAADTGFLLIIFKDGAGNISFYLTNSNLWTLPTNSHCLPPLLSQAQVREHRQW